MKKYLFILLFVALSLGFIGVVKAADGVGTSCEKGDRKKLCQGNTVVTLGCPYTCHYQEDKDRCNKAEYACSDKCDQDRDKCVCNVDPALGGHLQGTIADKAYMNCSDNCHDTLYRCYASCGKKHSQCEAEAKEADEACLKTLTWIKTDEEACRGTLVCLDRPSGAVCTVAKSATPTPAPAPASTYEKCDYAEHNQKFAACVDACDAIDASTITGYDKFKACMHSCNIPLECKTTPVSTCAPDETAYDYDDAKCMDKCALLESGNPYQNYERINCSRSCFRKGCLKDGELVPPASNQEDPEECIRRAAQEFWDSPAYINAQLECSRKGVVLPDKLDACLRADPGFAAREELSMQQADNCMPRTPTSKRLPSDQDQADTSIGVTFSRAQLELEVARGVLAKLKEMNDPRWADKKDFAHEYNAEFARTLDQLSLDQETKDETIEKIKDLRGTFEDIHEIAEKGVGWQDFPETLDSIKKGDTGISYGKLDLATDAVKSFNEYQDDRAKGMSVQVAGTKAALNNYGSTVVTSIPVLGAIDLVASTPDVLLNIAGVDKKNWWRTTITAGFIGKFAPSDVIKQTTEIMAANNWSNIGDALTHQWGKVKAADGVLNTAHESAKLFYGTIGAVPVSVARGLSDVVGGTIFVGERALSFADRLFR